MNIDGIIEFYNNAQILRLKCQTIESDNEFEAIYYNKLIELIEENSSEYPYIYAIIKIYKSPYTLWKILLKPIGITKGKFQLQLKRQYNKFCSIVEAYEKENEYLLVL